VNSNDFLETDDPILSESLADNNKRDVFSQFNSMFAFFEELPMIVCKNYCVVLEKEESSV
jgi:hypothetical protein